jgi:hypothetical protein
MTTTSSSVTSPFFSLTLPGPGWSICPCADLRLGRPSQGLRWKFLGYIRAPWELMGSPKLPPAARGIPARVHPTVFKAAHRVAQHHQIKMKESNQLATSFITPFGMYCYTTMPFGLRNAGATYQKCMNHVFGEHIGRMVEAYVDDIVVKTRKASDLLSDLEATFRCLKAKSVKLNPEKCVFGVP